MVILSATNIQKFYGSQDTKTAVIDKISLDINQGDFVAITGQSGSGKSTLLYLLSGLEQADSGQVMFEGKELGKLKDSYLARLRRTEISFCYQYHNLIHNLSILDNILLPKKIDGKITKSDKEFLQNLIEISDIKDTLYKLPSQVSGGQQQRAAIVRALFTKPKVIFLDEPTGSLDSANAIKVMELLKDINTTYKTAIVMATHSEKLSQYAKRIINIKDGRIENA
ncbi:MAG: ABC transporter ATP-binding protein [Clostridiales bacterium]|nr:ABC transporter ATP-binding protein [Clostridiales bacterium]